MDDSTPGQQPLDAHQTEEEVNVEPVTKPKADRPDHSSGGNDTSKFHGDDDLPRDN
jgi:hypothetical protein